MLVSTRGRYALRVLIDLAENGQAENGETVRIPLMDIAARQAISEKYLEIILSVLVRGGFLSGLRGKGGGYQLTRPPQDYTVASVLSLVEDTIAPIACLSNEINPCERAVECRTLPMWQGLDRIIHEYLEGITIADLSKPELSVTASGKPLCSGPAGAGDMRMPKPSGKPKE